MNNDINNDDAVKKKSIFDKKKKLLKDLNGAINKFNIPIITASKLINKIIKYVMLISWVWIQIS